MLYSQNRAYFSWLRVSTMSPEQSHTPSSYRRNKTGRPKVGNNSGTCAQFLLLIHLLTRRYWKQNMVLSCLGQWIYGGVEEAIVHGFWIVYCVIFYCHWVLEHGGSMRLGRVLSLFLHLHWWHNHFQALTWYSEATPCCKTTLLDFLVNSSRT